VSKPPKHVPLPTKKDLLDFIRDSPNHVGKRELARAFGMTGPSRTVLRQLLKELEQSGEVQRGRGRRVGKPGSLPETLVVEIVATDSDGELIGRPLAWAEKERPPRIYMAPQRRRGEPVVGVGDRVLAKLRRLRDDTYEGRTIRRITAAPATVLGVYRQGPQGGRLEPTDRRHKQDYVVPRGESGGAEPGELVLAEIMPAGPRPMGLRPVKVVERLGSALNPKAISLVAIHAAGIPTDFSEASLEQAKHAGPATMKHRVDLRNIPLVTIDGEDARDFDDAVYAEPDPEHPGGWHVIVAIADVSWYVQPGDALDRDAFERGNSVYFPDRVVPMLPFDLSSGWCSLKPDEERGCLAVHMRIDAEGNKRSHKFVRGMMRSAARLTYDQVQRAIDGQTDEVTGPLLEPVIKPLYGAWKALFAARERRHVLDLDLPERKVVLDDEGRVVRVEPRPRYDSHRLIEDMMIAANVCAAETLEKVHQPCMYRVHDQPTPDKLDALRDFLSTLSLSVKLAKGQVLRPEHFNRILEAVKDTPQSHLVSEVVLRSQAQAIYSPENLGHFGLNLARYAHFTSPIRRYADLLVHRALVKGLQFGDGPLSDDEAKRFADIGQHISQTERRAAAAERDAVNRYTAAFLAEKVGASFAGRISGVSRFGLFVALDESGADGFIPAATLGDDYYVHDEAGHALIGRRTRKTHRLGDAVEVLLAEANPLTGSLLFHLLDGGKSTADSPRRFSGGRPERRSRRST
jgi:ribonuclease R